ncbi:hypothetical protein EFA69_08745 [Rufibacter immobilis]|uniref:Uncharacterized protein n=1 Tax=Rufibacter immobilis TaxID=1348778 RepID=A0A3M9MVS9_9BACT|nr:hypothetical protein [Rufibacter immobilis]RNI29636.1 hypothetical protein EFA69_08745 [Rufibacter immobilis]
MKKTVLLFSCLLALAACKQNSSDAQDNKEAQLEEAAGAMDEEALDAQTPQTPDGAAPSTSQSEAMSEEPLPGATSTASTPPSSANPLFNLTLRPGQVGAVRVGMPIDEARKQYGNTKFRETTLLQEGTETKAFEVLGERRRTDMVVEQECTGTNCRVFRIKVINPAFKTPGGVGIGSTLADVKKSFPITSISAGEGKLYAISQEAKMSFALNATSIPAGKWGSLKVKDVPDNTPVSEILVY